MSKKKVSELTRDAVAVMLHRLSGYRKPHLTRLDSALGILLVLSPFANPVSHRLCGKGLTNEANTRLYPLSRIKSVSGIRNISFQSAEIMVSLDKNIQLYSPEVVFRPLIV